MNTRKLCLTAALVIIAGIGAFAQDGLGLGVKGGITGSWMPGTYVDVGDQVIPNIGFYGGIYGFAELSDTMFGQVELLYSRKGCTTNNPILGKYTRNISYLQIPILIGFKISDDKFNFAIGPAIAYCVGNKIKSEIPNPSSAGEVAPFNFSAILQARYAVTEGFGVDLRFDFGASKTFKSEDKGHNSSAQIGVSYMFGQ